MINYEVDVSIVIPSYNMNAFIAQSIHSAIEQEYESFEVIVCDNCSTDSTYEIAKSIVNDRLRVLANRSNIGAVGNFNRLISESRGKYIKFLEADDILEKDCLKKMVDCFSDSSINLVSCSASIIDENGMETGILSSNESKICSGKSVIDNMRINGNEIGTPSDVLIRASIFDKVGVFDVCYGSYLNDWDLWIRICRHGNVAFLPDKLVKVRRHTGQIGFNGAMSNQDIIAIFMMVDRNFKSIGRFKNQIHFSSEYILRGVKRLVKFRDKVSIKYLIDTFSVIKKKSSINILIMGFAYSIIFLPYLRHKAKIKRSSSECDSI